MKRPNIVFILIDDMGWMDLSCQGSGFYETPALDALAGEGMRFTQCSAACPVCSPTRASILSGQYPARVGVTDWIAWNPAWHPLRGRLIDAPYARHLPPGTVSLAGALRAGGYATWHVGKWHLGTEAYWPDKHGFDVNVGGSDMGMPWRGYFAPWRLANLPEGPDGQYLTDRLTDEAIALIRSRRRGQPFFLNLWHYGLHTPIQAPAPLVDKYQAKAARLGLAERDPFEIGEPMRTIDKAGRHVRRRLFQSDPVYAAMVENLDTNTARLLAVLNEEGLAEDTLVVFTSDNGGLATAEGSPTCNAPLAQGKGWMYEGGTREPLLVRWPAVVPPGTLCHQPLTSPDFYPTLLELAGLDPLPAQHVDGVSFAPLLRGRPGFDRGPIFWHYPHYGNQGGQPGCSVRRGDWKLIEFFEDRRLELYNLAADLGETRDLAGDNPSLAAGLRDALHGWLENVGAKFPQPNPDWHA